MDDFLSNFVLKDDEKELSDSKKDVMKFLKQIGVDTRFVSFFDDEGDIKLYIENLRFSKFSKKRRETFNKHYPDMEVVRSSLFQKICSRSSKTLADSLSPKERILIPRMDDDYNKFLYIVIEPYSRKYGIKFIEYDENISADDFDSVISPLNLNQEVNHILNDIFDGKGIEWDKKLDLSNIYDLDLKDKNIIFPFINVPQEWINDFLGIEKEYEIDYENEDIAESFMGFLTEINPQFKENVLAASSFLESHQKQ